MIALIGDDQVVRTGQRGENAQVGRVSGGEDQRGGEAGMGGESVLQVTVQGRRSGHQPASGGARAPGSKRPHPTVDHVGMTRQPQVVVAGQVQLAGWVAGGPGGGCARIHSAPQAGLLPLPGMAGQPCERVVCGVTCEGMHNGSLWSTCMS